MAARKRRVKPGPTFAAHVNPGVGDLAPRLATRGAYLDGDSAASGRVRDGAGDEVVDGLAEAVGIEVTRSVDSAFISQFAASRAERVSTRSTDCCGPCVVDRRSATPLRPSAFQPSLGTTSYGTLQRREKEPISYLMSSCYLKRQVITLLPVIGYCTSKSVRSSSSLSDSVTKARSRTMTLPPMGLNPMSPQTCFSLDSARRRSIPSESSMGAA